MDEENKEDLENQDGQGSQSVQEQNMGEKVANDVQSTAQGVKDTANLAKNAATHNWIGVAKDALNLLKNKAFLKKVLIGAILSIALPVLIYFSVISSVGSMLKQFWDNLWDFSDDSSKSATIKDDGSIEITNDQVDEIINSIDDLGIDTEDLWLLGDVDYQNSTDPEEQAKYQEEYENALRKYVRKFWEAQVTTQTLNYNKGNDKDKTYGAVYVYRSNGQKTIDANSKGKQLTYTSYENLVGTSTTDSTDSTNTTTSALDNFLFIGDSRTRGIEAKLKTLGENISVQAVDGTAPNVWIQVSQTGSATVGGKSIELPKAEDVKGISIALGVNGTNQIVAMKQLLENLLKRYPDVPIYVNSVFHVATTYHYNNGPDELNSSIDKFNSEMSNYCNGNPNLNYIDITDGLYDESGYLKEELADSEGLHLTDGGNILVQNISKAITGEDLQAGGTAGASNRIANPSVRGNPKDYFSIDSKGNLIVLGSKKNVQGNNVQDQYFEVVIDYEEVISPYTTPMNFLLYLTMVSQNPEFVSAVADLIKDSAINITILDEREIVDNSDQSATPMTAGDRTIHTATTKSRTTTEKTKAAVTYVKTWFCEQTIKYELSSATSPEEVTYSAPPPGDGATSLDWQKYWASGASIHRSTTTTEEYIKQPTEGAIDRLGEKGDQGVYDENGNGKVDKYDSDGDGIADTGETINEDTRFLGLLDDKFKIPNSKVYEVPGINIISGADWIFELLQMDSQTQNLEQIMRYALYKYTGNDYGVKELDFSIYDVGEFKQITSEYSGTSSSVGGVEGKIIEFLASKGVPDIGAAAILANIQAESGFDPTIVNSIGASGLCQWLGVRCESLKSLANSRGVDWTDVDLQLEFMWSELEQGAFSSVRSNIMSGTDLEKVTWHWGRYYEVYFSTGTFESTRNGTEQQKRYTFAKQWLERLQSGQSSSGSSGEGLASGSSGNASSVASGSKNQKLQALFPNGVPTTESQMSRYLTTVSIPITTKNGVKTTKQVLLHKSVAADVQEVLQIAQNAGFKVYDAQTYNFRPKNNGNPSSGLSAHSYGLAIDINPNENYSRRGSTVYAGSFWDPSKSEYSIPRNGKLVNAFKSKGWRWGGDWSGNYQDYMHFSFTGD